MKMKINKQLAFAILGMLFIISLYNWELIILRVDMISRKMMMVHTFFNFTTILLLLLTFKYGWNNSLYRDLFVSLFFATVLISMAMLAIVSLPFHKGFYYLVVILLLTAFASVFILESVGKIIQIKDKHKERFEK